MIPEERFSTETVRGVLLNPWSRDRKISYHWGPVQVQDPSQGLLVKLWTLRVIGNDAVLSAPGSPTEVLFTRANGLDNVSLSFDQNGRPCVCFEEEVGGSAFLYWFDPVPNAPVFMPIDGNSPRITLDDARAFNGANSDVILGYVRAGFVRYRRQRDRFTVEYTPLIGPGGTPAPATRLRHISMNSNLRLEFLTDGAGEEPWTLGDVVEDLCVRAGIPPESVDVRELYEDIVPGMKVTSTDGFSSDIDRLREVFNFDKSVVDRKIRWPKRGREPVAWIPYSDLLGSRDEPLKQTLVDEQKLPREIHIEHIDPDGGYAKNKQTARRRSNLVKAEKSETISSGLVLTADQAASAVLQKLKVRWNEQVEFEFTTSIKYTFVTPADVVMVEDAKGVWHRVRIEERNEDNGEIDWTAKQDAGARAYSTKHVGNSLPPPTPTSPGIIGETRFEILNIPVQRGQDDELGLYVAACGESSAWAGYQLLFSSDEGASYTEAFQSDNASVIGDTLTTLLEEPAGYTYPSSQTVEVLVNFPLDSVSYDQLLQRKNLCVIGDEVLQFQTATLLEQVGDKYRYLLSRLLRGRFYTQAETWPQDTRFVLLDSSVIFVPIDRIYLGADLWYKPVSLGLTSDETAPTAYLFDEGVSQREFPVSNVGAVRDGSNNVTVTWVGAARLGVDTSPYHSKYFRGYRVKFSNGHTIDTTSQTATYHSAPVGVTVQVCALNEITGEGPYSPAIAT